MPTAQKSLTLSTLAYRRLLRMYPPGFRDQFGEPMAQAFGDLARRAVGRGGATGLVLLWMRMVPDIARSALREYLNLAARVGPSNPRLRWILACTLGAGLGVLAGARLAWLGFPVGAIASMCLTLVLGLFQAVWALRRSGPDVVRWMAATMVGGFALAMPFRIAVGGLPPLSGLSTSAQIGTLLLSGAGIGLLQYVVSPGMKGRAWRWVAANAFGMLAAAIVSRALIIEAGSTVMAALLQPFVGGLTFGGLTVLAFDSIHRPEEVTVERPASS
jgi:hypothetical protein